MRNTLTTPEGKSEPPDNDSTAHRLRENMAFLALAFGWVVGPLILAVQVVLWLKTGSWLSISPSDLVHALLRGSDLDSWLLRAFARYPAIHLGLRWRSSHWPGVAAPTSRSPAALCEDATNATLGRLSCGGLISRWCCLHEGPGDPSADWNERPNTYM